MSVKNTHRVKPSDIPEHRGRGEDPGFGLKFSKKRKRVINKDGSFNAKRIKSGFSPRNAYQTLIKMPWPTFLLLVITSLIAINALFAALYLWVGIENLSGVVSSGFFQDFLHTFYFSFQTFTTLGYGHIAPESNLASFIAAMEAMIGLICFALVTGLIYGRFSRPTARLLYSEKALIVPDKEGLSLQFRVANLRMSTLMEMEATVLLKTVKKEKNGFFSRKFVSLKLERNFILFFPLNWTIVHAIDEESPLYGKDDETLKEMEAEILILIKGFDDTFGQTVHSRYSYLCNEIVWGGRFKPAFYTNERGEVILDMTKLHSHEVMDLNQ